MGDLIFPRAPFFAAAFWGAAAIAISLFGMGCADSTLEVSPDADGGEDGGMDSDTDTDTDTGSDVDSDGDVDSDTDSDTDTDTDTDADADADTDTDSDADGGADADADSDTDTDTGEAVPPPLCSIEIDCGGQEIPDEPKISCQIAIDDGAGLPLFDGPIGIEKRGRSSLSFPKPQYTMELRDEFGADVSADLLGMGGESDWVLNGAYIDRSLLRNKLAYDLFQSFGGKERFAPQSGYCELTLDGTWNGIYLLTEKIERDDDRVDIAADPGDGTSFVVKQDDSGFQAVGSANGSWAWVYPKESSVTVSQLSGVGTWLSGWAAAVAGSSSASPFDFVDLESAVDFVLLEELLKNNDAYFLSQHVWKEAGGKLRFAPWDVDLSLGQPYYNDNHNPEGWILYRPNMIAAMAARAEFSERLVSRWAELREGPLSNSAIFEAIDFYTATLDPWIDANVARWPIGEIDWGGELYPVTSYDDEISLVRAFIETRLAWIDANIGAY